MNLFILHTSNCFEHTTIKNFGQVVKEFNSKFLIYPLSPVQKNLTEHEKKLCIHEDIYIEGVAEECSAKFNRIKKKIIMGYDKDTIFINLIYKSRSDPKFTLEISDHDLDHNDAVPFNFYLDQAYNESPYDIIKFDYNAILELIANPIKKHKPIPRISFLYININISRVTVDEIKDLLAKIYDFYCV
ncbi:MAG: hypothetical protein JKX76_00910 [Colwellia sp.]|nr:hypothetical protein [Colwellia sp.]